MAGGSSCLCTRSRRDWLCAHLRLSGIGVGSSGTTSALSWMSMSPCQSKRGTHVASTGASTQRRALRSGVTLAFTATSAHQDFTQLVSDSVFAESSCDWVCAAVCTVLLVSDSWWKQLVFSQWLAATQPELAFVYILVHFRKRMG